MEQEISFEDIKLRPRLPKGSNLYLMQIEKIHKSAWAKNPRTYCSTHHSIETRTTKDYTIHKNCIKMSPKDYSGKNKDDTEEKFIALCTKLKYANEEGLLYVYFTGEESNTQKNTEPVQAKLAPSETTNVSFPSSNFNSYPLFNSFTTFPVQPSFPFSPFSFYSSPIQMNPNNFYNIITGNNSPQVQNIIHSSHPKEVIKVEAQDSISEESIQPDITDMKEALEKLIFKLDQRLTDLENKVQALSIKMNQKKSQEAPAANQQNASNQESMDQAPKSKPGRKPKK